MTNNEARAAVWLQKMEMKIAHVHNVARSLAGSLAQHRPEDAEHHRAMAVKLESWIEDFRANVFSARYDQKLEAEAYALLMGAKTEKANVDMGKIADEIVDYVLENPSVTALETHPWQDTKTAKFFAPQEADGPVCIMIGGEHSLVLRQELAMAAAMFPVGGTKA